MNFSNVKKKKITDLARNDRRDSLCLLRIVYDGFDDALVQQSQPLLMTIAMAVAGFIPVQDDIHFYRLFKCLQ